MSLAVEMEIICLSLSTPINTWHLKSLIKKKYKKSGDVYAFAVTMLECFTWKEVYPKSIYRFPWSIADSVSK